MKRILTALSILCLAAAPAFAGNYAIDKSHTTIGFSVKHMVISNVKGNFGDFSGTFSFDEEKKALTAASATIKTASINTNELKRDDHLRSPDFFDAAKNPDISFVMKKARSLGGGKLEVAGDLTIKGVTKPVTLTGEFLGAATDPWGNARVGFTAEGEINRMDFGISFNKVIDNGGLLVGEKVKLQLEIEGILQK